MAVLPDHLFCIWTLPPGDADYKTRWALIKAGFSRCIPLGEQRSQGGAFGSAGIGSVIRDDRDCERHVDYIHWNPVKYGWVKQVRLGRIQVFTPMCDEVSSRGVGPALSMTPWR